MHRPRARGEWRRLAPVAHDGQDGEHLEGDDGPGDEANPPRQHQPGAAERTPVQVLAHLDAATAALSRHAVVWRKGRIIQLRDFLAGPEGYSGAEAAGLAGRVVGSSYTGQGDHAVLWDKRGIRDLGVLEGGYRSNAFDINPSGQVVGVSNLQDETEHAFLWTNGKMTDLGLLPGDRYLSVAFGISPSGQVVGFSGWYPHAFLWADGIMTALPTLGGRYSSASAINARGQVVGDSDLSDSPPDFIAGHAVLWTIK